MKRYKFPLRPVAVLRLHTERKAKEALAVTVHAYVSAEENLAAIRKRTQELEKILFAGRTGRFQAGDQASFLQAYRKECSLEMEAQRTVIAAKAEMEKARAVCIEANKQVKIIEKLEEHAKASYRAQLLRSEQDEFDEIASQRLARSRN